MRGTLIGIVVFTAVITGLVIWGLESRKPPESVVLRHFGAPGYPESIVLGLGGLFDYQSYGNPGGDFETELEFWHVRQGILTDREGSEVLLSQLSDRAQKLDLHPRNIRLILYHRSGDAVFEELYFRLEKVVKMQFGEIRLRNAEHHPYPSTANWIPLEDQLPSPAENFGPTFYVLVSRTGTVLTEKLGTLEIDKLPAWYADGRITPEHVIVIQAAAHASIERVGDVIEAFRSVGGDGVQITLSVDDGRISTQEVD